MYQRKQTGFTIVELIVVIAIIAILSAIAIPRFINQTTKARVAALNGLAGAINSAAALAKAQYIAAGDTAATTVTMDGTSVMVTPGTGADAGYPTAMTGGIDKAITVSGFTFTPPTFTIKGVTASSCNLTYDATTGTATVNAAATAGPNGC